MNYKEKWNELQEKLKRALDTNKCNLHNAITEGGHINYETKIETIEAILWIMNDMINPVDQKEYGEIR